ncbi:uncharacterized protein FFNC_15554 [Fusarium fujikuroi]|nr:uncharacterized protein FFNC_15554 [Fusarium fujikuroi]
MASQDSDSLIADPLSARMIAKIQATYALAKKLYPSWKSLKQTKQIHRGLLAGKLSWTKYRQKFASIQAPDGLTVSFSLRELASAGTVDSESFEMYLVLLRGLSEPVEITEIVEEGDYEAFVSSLDLSKTYIIPVKHEYGWSFSVFRSGNKHWYQDGLISASATMSEIATAQTQGGNGSAAYVLLGIRLLSQGLPQVDLEDFRTLDNGLTNWCTRLLVELSCGRLDPDDVSVSEQYYRIEQYCNTEQEADLELDEYCRRVLQLTDKDLPTDARVSVSPMQRSLSPNEYASACPKQTSLSPNTNISPPRVSDSPLSNTSTSSTTSDDSPSSSPLPGMTTTQDDMDMKNILGILSSAALAVRKVAPNPKSYEVLLNILSKKGIDSCFHLRRCKQQLYSQSLEGDTSADRSSEDSPGGSDVAGLNWESLRREAQQWERIRDWCNRNCVPESSILCAIPKGEPWNYTGLENLCARLMDDDDKLGDLLKKTGELCDAIVACDLPPNLLPVEVYGGKENNTCRFGFHAARISCRLGFIKISLHLRKPLRIRPGQYIDLWMPSSVGSIFQSHPMSVVSWSSDPQKVLFICARVQKGFTSTLLERVKYGDTTSIAMFTGPHGVTLPLDNYDQVLLIATDLGVVSLLPYMQYLAYQSHFIGSRTKRIHLVWRLNDWSLTQVLEAPLNAALEYDESGGDIGEGTFRRTLESVISISIYGQSQKTEGDKKALEKLERSSRVELKCGQWNLRAVVKKDTVSSDFSLGQSGKPSAIAASVSPDIRIELNDIVKTSIQYLDLMYTDYQPEG